MTERQELIELTGQAINGMLSADSSTITKILDCTAHSMVAKIAVGIAQEAIKHIDIITNN